MACRTKPPPRPGSRVVMGSMLRAYPLGPQVLHGRVSLEEFKQPLGCGRCLLHTGALAASQGGGGAGLICGLCWSQRVLKNTTRGGTRSTQ